MPDLITIIFGAFFDFFFFQTQSW